MLRGIFTQTICDGFLNCPCRVNEHVELVHLKNRVADQLQVPSLSLPQAKKLIQAFAIPLNLLEDDADTRGGHVEHLGNITLQLMQNEDSVDDLKLLLHS